MILYSTVLSPSALHYALRGAQAAGHVTEHATFIREIDARKIERGRRKDQRKIDFVLGATEQGPREKRRRTANDARFYALSFAEWGYFLAEVFARDPRAEIGPYNGADDFARQTKGRFPLPEFVLAA